MSALAKPLHHVDEEPQECSALVDDRGCMVKMAQEFWSWCLVADLCKAHQERKDLGF